jgi:dTDP-4-dehydrorhamnose reductase
MVATIKEMKWLILGGDGQLGRAMSVELAKNKAEYISLGRLQLDITNQQAIESIFEKNLPDVVLNAAAWTNVDSAETSEDEARLINAYGPQLLAEACSKINAKLVHISTDYVFSGISDIPWSENSEVAPVSAYGRTKAAGERAVSETYPNSSYIVRTAWLYSPWGKNFVKTLIKLALTGSGNVEVVSDQIGQPTSAVDLVRQIRLMVIENVSPGIYHGTNSGQASWFELAQEIFKLAEEDSGRVLAVNSTYFSRPAKRPAYSVLGGNHWMEEGLSPMRTWKEALAEAFPEIVLAIKQGE